MIKSKLNKTKKSLTNTNDHNNKNNNNHNDDDDDTNNYKKKVKPTADISDIAYVFKSKH